MTRDLKIARLMNELSIKVQETIAQSPKIDRIRDQLKDIGFLGPIFVSLAIEFQKHPKHSIVSFRTAIEDKLLSMNPQFPRESKGILEEYAKISAKILAETQSILKIINDLARLGHKDPIILYVSGQAETS